MKFKILPDRSGKMFGGFTSYLAEILWYDITGFSGRGRVKMDFYKRADLVMKKFRKAEWFRTGRLRFSAVFPEMQDRQATRSGLEKQDRRLHTEW